MNTTPEKLRLRIFFGGLLIAAMVVNGMVASLFWRAPQALPTPPVDTPQPIVIGPQQRQEPPPRPEPRITPADTPTRQEVLERPAPMIETFRPQRTGEDPAVLHAKYLAQYLNSGVARTPGMKAAALAMVSEDGKFNSALNAAVANRFQTNSVQLISSFFRPAFVADGLFAEVIAGSTAVFQKLDLSTSVDVLVLGRQEVRYSTEPSLENLVTANMRLEVTVISTSTGAHQSWTFVANGPGFKQTEARQMAEERLIKQIARDTKISLGL